MIANEPTLSRIGLGASRMGSFNNPQPLSESVRLVQFALEIGVTAFDTSNIYGQGDSERAIGRALAGAPREQAFIVTKGGRQFSLKARALSWFKPIVRPLLAARQQGSLVTARRGEELRADWSAAALAASLDGSLRRLRTDRVDGFILHSPPAAVITAQVADALAAIKASGKARHVGISCDDEAALEAAMAVPGLTMLELPADLMGTAARHAEAVTARGIIIFVREILRAKPGRSPVAAVAEVLADPLTGCALLGTTRAGHLSEVAGHLA
jgi:aryl-alcohol dehydrogenase-like predicted oxidoreductase